MRTSMSVTSPSTPRVIASRSASMFGAKRSWKLMAADELALAADREDAARVVEIAAHRLLDECRAALAACARGCRRCSPGGTATSKTASGADERFVEEVNTRWKRELLGSLARGVGVDVEDAGDGEAEARVHGQVRVADDAAGADDDDRARGRTAAATAGVRPARSSVTARTPASSSAHHSPGCAPGAGSCSDSISRCHSRRVASLARSGRSRARGRSRRRSPCA